MKTTARVIITQRCPRKCPNCVNTYQSILQQAKPIYTLGVVADYAEVCITGGEPMLDMKRTTNWLRYLRNTQQTCNPTGRIYLYTSWYHKESWLRPNLTHLIDGIHYTLHYPCSRDDAQEFKFFQDDALLYGQKLSLRLYVDQRVDKGLLIFPSLWQRVEMKPWQLDGECKLPDHEDLFILKE